MLRLRFLSALLSAVVIMSASVESMALFTSRDPGRADLGVLNQQQLNRKEADIAFSETELSIADVNIIKSGSSSRNKVRLTVQLTNNSFTEIERGQDAGGWVLELPEGARAYIANDVKRGDRELVLAIEGLASDDNDSYIVVAVPGSVVLNKTESVVKSRINTDAPWEILSSQYEAIEVEEPEEEEPEETEEVHEEDEEDTSEEEEKAVRKLSSDAEELSEEEIKAVKDDLVASLKGKAAAYREITIDSDKFISAEAMEEIYDYAIDAGKTDTQLANVCLLFVNHNDEGNTDSRLYVPFRNLVLEGNGINPVITKDMEKENMKEIGDLFKQKSGKEGQVIFLEHDLPFGADTGVVTAVEGEASTNRYKILYAYDEETKSFSKFPGNYEVDSSGYLHFFTDAGGYFVLA